MAELIIKNLTVNYGPDCAVNSLTVPDKTFAAAVCDNASAFFRAVSGIEKFPRGEIILNGKNITHTETSKRNIALVFRDCALYGSLTVYQNISACLRRNGIDGAGARSKIMNAAKVFGFEVYTDAKPASLTAEQRLRAELGRISLLTPDLVLLNDPLKSIPAVRYDIMKDEILKLFGLLETSFLYIIEDIKPAVTVKPGFAGLTSERINFIAAS